MRQHPLATAAADRVAAVIRESPTPATAVGVFDTAGVIVRTVVGVADLTSARPAGPDDWWDLASLTKVLVTLPEVLALVDRGALDLDQRLADAWDLSGHSPVAAATIRQLLSFNAGMPAIVKLFDRWPGEAHIIDAVLATPPERPIGSRALYSDTSFMLLGQLVEDLTGRSLSTLAATRTGLRFGPLPGAAVATEHCSWRRRLIVGEVHDENASAMGGIAGHAGAFGTLDLVVEAARSWLRRDVISNDLHEQARTCWSVSALGERYGLGWWLSPRPGLGGRMAGADGFGCTGFVGNRIWLEPEHGYGVVILSNRIHPSRENPAPFLDWCDLLFDTVAKELRR